MSKQKRAVRRRAMQVMRKNPCFIRVGLGWEFYIVDPDHGPLSIETTPSFGRWGYRVYGPKVGSLDAKSLCEKTALDGLCRSYDEAGRYCEMPKWAPHEAWVRRAHHRNAQLDSKCT